MYCHWQHSDYQSRVAGYREEDMKRTKAIKPFPTYLNILGCTLLCIGVAEGGNLTLDDFVIDGAEKQKPATVKPPEKPKPAVEKPAEKPKPKKTETTRSSEAPSAADMERKEQQFWESTERCATLKCYQAYVKKYPHGHYAPIAEEQIRQLHEAPNNKPEVASTTPVRLKILEPEMLSITGGEFQMGSPENEPKRYDNERQHQVRVEDFRLSKTEIRVKEFQQFVTETGYLTEAEEGNGCFLWSDGKMEKKANSGWRAPGFEVQEEYPVVCVTIQDALAYTKWLSKKTGKNFRLPTEAEWEYACRGGRVGEAYCGSSNPTLVSWYGDNSDSSIHPVAQKAANAFGLHDMSGNVWEWTCSEYDRNYGDKETQCVDPGDEQIEVTVRSGSWSSFSGKVRAAFRFGYPGHYRFDNLGFRIAEDVAR